MLHLCVIWQNKPFFLYIIWHGITPSLSLRYTANGYQYRLATVAQWLKRCEYSSLFVGWHS